MPNELSLKDDFFFYCSKMACSYGELLIMVTIKICLVYCTLVKEPVAQLGLIHGFLLVVSLCDQIQSP